MISPVTIEEGFHTASSASSSSAASDRDVAPWRRIGHEHSDDGGAAPAVSAAGVRIVADQAGKSMSSLWSSEESRRSKRFD